MNKPLGYYTPHIPGDKSLLDELEQQHGSNFENLTPCDKFYLISFLAENLRTYFCSSTAPGSNQAMLVADQLFNNRILNPSTKLGLIKFLADNISLGKNRFKTSTRNQNFNAIAVSQWFTSL